MATFTLGMDVTLGSTHTSGNDVTFADAPAITAYMQLVWDCYVDVQNSSALLWNLTQATGRLGYIGVDTLATADSSAGVANIQVDVLTSQYSVAQAALGAIDVDLLTTMQDLEAVVATVQVDVLSYFNNSQAALGVMAIDVLSTNDDITPRPRVFVTT